jgi:hypothetical protein
MAITESLRLILTADSRGAVQSIQQVGRTAERELSRSEKSLDRWGNRLTNVGAGMVAFGAVAAAGLSEAAQAAGELEQAVGGTEAVFGDASDIIDEYAGKAAKAAGLSEAEFRVATTSIGGNLKRMGFDVDEAASKSVELTQVAADLAATYGGTTAEAVAALGAAFRGEADPAERFNLDLKVSKVNAEAVALGLATSTSAVDDHAKAQALLSLIMEQGADAAGQYGREADTLAGRQQTLSAEFSNLKADIGEGVLPVMEALFSVAQGGIGTMTGLNDATGGMVGQVATIATVASLGLGGLSLLVGQAIKMRDNFVLAREAVANFAGSGGLGRLTRAGLIVGGLIALREVVQALDDDLKGIDVATLENELLDLARTGEAAGGQLGGMLDDLNAAFESGDPQRIEAMGDQLGELDKALAQLAGRDPETAAAAFGFITDELVRLGANRGEVKGLFDDYAAAATSADTASRVAADGVGEVGGALGESAESTDAATGALEAYASQLQAMTDPVFAAMDAITGVRDAQVGLAEAERGVLEAQVALDEAIATHGATSAEAAEATLGLEDAQRGLADAQWGAVTSAAEADSALAGLKDAVDNGKVSVDTFRDTLAQWVAQGFLTQAQADAAAGSVAGLAAEADVADSKRVDIPVAAPGSPSTWQALRDVKEEALSIPGYRNTHVSASGVSTVIGQFDALARAINRASGGNIRVSVGGGGGLILHEGGYVPGPRGQEVAAILQAGERVLSLDEVDSMSRGIPAAGMGGGVGGSWVDNRTVIYQISNQDPQGTIEAIKRYERVNGPGWRAA